MRLRDLIRRGGGSDDDLQSDYLLSCSEVSGRYQEMPAGAGNWHKVMSQRKKV